MDVEFEQFARQRLPGLVRFAAALTGDRELAQDLVQDALAKAHRRWSVVRAADHPDLYLRRMVVNGYLSWRRRWYQRTVEPASDSGVLDRGRVDDPAGRVADADQIATLLTKLTKPQRVAIVLRFFEERTDEEIAEVLGCAPATVRSHVHRGLRALRVRADAQTAREVAP
ncbi:RNA polymerase sigma-70 factor (sigma-E family) [Herbihabitans rhizosphaerae]|uniref:RNA polymerase sigma-70 factor (Sigma-E family) n=1 Tax=Herbihabitans rhizosphaerae TaxID=1872711 RepID=A0A4Q7KQ82_9PSEU|nr:SigE family RNA polymerase sigma factor [Herbihabitans rhizosphaerae]RZS37462.1 RNA polymerase sigma-70 factor (sigma-E family) [Herbihabitans rhizosphaerae]